VEIVDTQIHRPLPLGPWPDFDPYAGYPRDGGDPLEAGPSSAAAMTVGTELAVAAMEAAGVDAALLYSDPEFCAVATARHPGRIAAVHDHYDPDAIGDADRFARELRATPGLLGVRLLPGIEYRDGPLLALLTENRWDPLLAAAERHGVPVVFFAPLRLGRLAPVARQFPELRIVVDHCGMPAPPIVPLGGDPLETLPDLLALAEFPNVAVKLTGLPVLAPGEYPFPGIWPVLNRLLEAFGAERLLWGSDVHRVTGRVWEPPYRVAGHERINYAELVGYLLHSEEVGPAEKEQMLGAAARRWFDWPAPEGP
jgi:L-fuconolactonase